MKLKTLTIAMGLAGMLIIIASLGRWFFIFYDPSQAILGTSIGIILLGFAYIYERLCKNAEDRLDLHTGLDALNIWVRDKFEKLELKE